MKRPHRSAPAQTAPAARVRRQRGKQVLPAEEFISRLRDLYVRVARQSGAPTARLSRRSGVPYESLRHFLEDVKHLLCPVNEEKLARALGRDGAFFRWLVRRYAGRADWEEKCVAAWRARLAH